LATLDLLEKLVDRCIQLLNYRSQRRKEIFASVVEPVFEKARPLVPDLLQFLTAYERACSQALAASNTPREAELHSEILNALSRSRESLVELREKMLATRIEVIKATEYLAQVRPFGHQTADDVSSKMFAALAVVFAPLDQPLLSRPRSLMDALDVLLDAQDQTSRRDVRVFVSAMMGNGRRVRADAETAWAEASRMYSALHLYSNTGKF
jgi:hypothetical protein